MNKKTLHIIIGPVLFLLLELFIPNSMPPKAKAINVGDSNFYISTSA